MDIRSTKAFEELKNIAWDTIDRPVQLSELMQEAYDIYACACERFGEPQVSLEDFTNELFPKDLEVKLPVRKLEKGKKFHQTGNGHLRLSEKYIIENSSDCFERKMTEEEAQKYGQV